MAKYSFSLFTLTAAASAVDESFIRRVAGNQAINCERNGRHARTENSCLQHTECAWVEQCQAAPSGCTGYDYSNCMDDLSCEWVGQPRSDNGYCEIQNSCGDWDHACERSCGEDSLCEWAEGCEVNNYARTDCGTASESLEVEEEPRRLTADQMCRHHRARSSCDGDYYNDCIWIGDDSTIGFCHSQRATPTPTPDFDHYPCGMLYSASACYTHADRCVWNGSSCGTKPVNPPPTACGMFYSRSSCPDGDCNWTGRECVAIPVRPPVVQCGMYYGESACNRLDGCTWNYHTDICVDVGTQPVQQPCGMIYANEACYNYDWCHWNGSSCVDGTAQIVDCSKNYSPSKCFDEYHWTRDYSRKRFTHVEACDWHYLLDKCLDA